MNERLKKPMSEMTNFGLKSIASYLLAFVLPLAPVLGAVAVLVVIDYFTGVAAAKKRGEAFISRRSRDSVYKFGGYVGVLVSATVLDAQYGIGFTAAAAMFINISEFLSILENAQTITGANFRVWFDRIVPKSLANLFRRSRNAKRD